MPNLESQQIDPGDRRALVQDADQRGVGRRFLEATLATYGIMYGVVKTTVYLPDELKAALERMARETGSSEAELIREGVRLAVERRAVPMPTIGIAVSDDPHFAEHVDDHLAGFGEK